MKLRKNKGITLITLILTVIILIILAGIVISMLSGENGLIEKAKKAASDYGRASEEENEYLNGLFDEQLPWKTLKEQVKSDNIGDFVDYQVQIGDIILGDGQDEDGTPNELDRWRILYNDGETVQIIYGFYLPNSTNLAINSGLVPGINNSDYHVQYNYDGIKNRTYLLNILDNENNWSSLLNGSVDLTEVGKAKGGADIISWVNSWNTKDYFKLYTDTYSNQHDGELMIDGIEGYYIGETENPFKNEIRIYDTLPDLEDSLYFPKGTFSSNYWINSATGKSECVFCTSYTGISYDSGINGEALRPVIYLNSNTYGEKEENGDWKLIPLPDEYKKDIELVVTPYTGIYDGQEHEVIKSVKVNPTNAKLEYSIDGGVTFSENVPKVKYVDNYTVIIKATAERCYTKVVTKTVTVNREYNEGKITDVILIQDYGDYINYQVTIGDTVLGDGLSNDGTPDELDRWRILYNDKNRVYVIYGKNLPNSTNLAADAGLAQFPVNDGVGRKDGDYNTTRKQVIDIFNNENNWIRLLNGNVDLRDVANIKGTLNVELFVASWNERENVPIYYETYYDRYGKYMSDGLDGYYFGNTKNGSKSVYMSIDSDKKGFNDTLFFPTKECGYWLTDASTESESWINVVEWTTSISSSEYETYSQTYNNLYTHGIRPVIALNSDVLTKKGNNGGWDISIDTSADKPEITLSATAYQGAYDGEDHNAITNVSVNPQDARIQYSIDGGQTFTEEIPKVNRENEYTVIVKATKAGYITKTVTKTVTVGARQITEGKITDVIMSIDYGTYIDYSVTIGDTVLGDGLNDDGTPNELDRWRILYNDKNNVYVIYGLYLPNSTNLAENAGLTVSGNYKVGNSNYTYNREQLINIFNNESNWSSLLNGSIDLRDVGVAKATVDLDILVKSWNAKGNIPLYTKTYKDKYSSLMSDGLDGYFIGKNPDQTSYSLSIDSNEQGYGDNLYFPQPLEDVGGKYWTSTPSGDWTSELVGIQLSSGFTYIYNGDYEYPIRPVLELTGDVLVKSNEAGGWELELFPDEEKQEITLSATAYQGAYDGKEHEAITSISVNPEDAKVQYSIDEGQTFTNEIPKVKLEDEYTVIVKATKAGYVTKTITKTVTVSQREVTQGSITDVIITDDYGTYIDYNVTIGDTVLGDGLNDDGTPNELDRWRIFYNDKNTVYVVYGFYLPNSTNLASNAGLNTSSEYCVGANTSHNGDRSEVIQIFNNGSNWASLLNGSIDLSNVATVKGTLDLDLFVASWNEKGNKKLYTNTYSKEYGSLMSDGLDGYYISSYENSTSYSMSIYEGEQGYRDSLYFPDPTSSFGGGYWFSTPSGSYYSNLVMAPGNGFNCTDCRASSFGIRPVLELTGDVLVTSNGEGGWELELLPEEEKQEITLAATVYQGAYDGEEHDIVTSISVNPQDAKVQYSIDGGQIFTEEIPKIKKANDYTLIIKATKAGYITKTITKTVTVSRDTQGTITDIIIADDYGDYIDYSVTIGDTVLGDGLNDDGTPNELDRWRIFYNDKQKVYVVYGSYLPNSTNLATNAGLYTSGSYGVGANSSHNGDRNEVIEILNNSENWSSLLNGTTDLSAVASIKGTISLDLFVASWNEKGNMQLYTDTYNNKYGSLMSDGLDGYFIGENQNSCYSSYSIPSNKKGYGDKLYIPDSNSNLASGYWFSTPSGSSYTYLVMMPGNSFNYTDCRATSFGIRPVIELESNIQTRKNQDGSWAIEIIPEDENAPEIELEAVAYKGGVNDGQEHKVITSVTVNPEDAKIQYSMDEGTTFTQDIPTISESNTYTVIIKASKVGYKTKIITKTITINDRTIKSGKITDIIIPQDYGNSIDYSVTVGDVTLDDWRIIYNDKENDQVYIITNNLVPTYMVENSMEIHDYIRDVVKLEPGTSDYPFAIYSERSIVDLTSKLGDTSKWEAFVKPSLRGKAVAKGAMEVEKWIDSWEQKGYGNFNIVSYYDRYGKYMDYIDEYGIKHENAYNGLYIGYGSNNPYYGYCQYLYSEPGIEDTLYYPSMVPAQGGYQNNYEYWLNGMGAYPSDSNYAVALQGNNYFDIWGYDRKNEGLRPVVCLSSQVNVNWDEDSQEWKIIEENTTQEEPKEILIDTRVQNAVYLGEPVQTLSFVRTYPIKGVTVEYSLNGGEFGTEIPCVTESGQYTVTIKATKPGCITKVLTKTVTITQVDLSDHSIVEVPKNNYKYTGSEIRPEVVVKETDSYYSSEPKRTLVKDQDYTVTYKNNINLGTATIQINGIGNYTGTTTAEFEIQKFEAENYGGIVDYSVALGDTILGDGLNDDGTPDNLDYWRLFYTQGSDIILIYGGYLPNSTGLAARAGLAEKSYSDFGVYSYTTRTDFVNIINDTKRWESLITTQLKGATAKGTVSLDMWTKSWNQKYTPNIYLHEYGQDNGITTYTINQNKNSSAGYYSSMGLSSETGYQDTLYFPYHAYNYNTEGYFFAELPRSDTSKAFAVWYNGTLHEGFVLSSGNDYGIRPTITISGNSNVEYNESTGKWDIVQGSYNPPVGTNDYIVGDEVKIGDEEFFVIQNCQSSDSTVTLLSKYNVNIDLLEQQNVELKEISTQFSSTWYWSNIEGEQESFDLPQEEGRPAETHIVARAAYDYGQKVGGTGRLMTYSEAESLLQTNKDLLIGSNIDAEEGFLSFWLGSVDPIYSNPDGTWQNSNIWSVTGYWGDTNLFSSPYSGGNRQGVRPVVTVNKNLVTLITER